MNDRIRLGLIGCGGRMMGSHVPGFAKRKDCEITAVCDVAESRREKAAKKVQELSGKRPSIFSNLRRVIESAQVDAVVIATPDHWHCPAAMLACQAGKDVYVEKPVSHSVAEGRQLIAVAVEHNRVVQVGAQNRSGESNASAREYLASGKLGPIELVRVYNQAVDTSIVNKPDAPKPAGLDWNQWLGPAPERPYNPGRHYGWRWYWDYAGGDVTDDTVHQLDLACQLLEIRQLPKTVRSVGIAHPGNDEKMAGTLATQFEFEDLVLLYNQTQNTPYMVKSDQGVRNGDLFPYWPQNGTRIEIFGEAGLMVVGRHGGGWQVFQRTKSRKPVVTAEQHGRFPDDAHKEDFLDAVRTRRTPNGDLESAHRSATLCHLANISYRVGNQLLEIDRERETIVGNDAANALIQPNRREGFNFGS
ncbi:MAG: Gfo/Idh/MocA family oxidoreductase [Lacipirellulaceae bacterium]